MRERKKVAVAMSGGVDSGVAAALLVEEGYETVGLHLRLWRDPAPHGVQGKGVNEEAAEKTAEKLGIPFYVKDYAKDFKKIVVDYFLAEYAAGRTPNPCVVCNQFIKFGKLLEYARALGCDYLATGHYARIVRDSSRGTPSSTRADVNSLSGDRSPSALSSPANTNLSDLQNQSRFASEIVSSDVPLQAIYRLLKGIDESKDQSYFLWTLTQEKLAQILFPIGDRKKSEVQKTARVKNLPVSERPESFEVCFIQDKDYRDFLKRHIPTAIKPGEVVNVSGKTIGRHFGLPLYTVGQRKGFEVRSSVPLYVVGVDVEKNRLIVGRGAESERQKFVVSGVNWIGGVGEVGDAEGVRCGVRVRYQGPLLKSKIKNQKAKITVELDEPTRGITPGQSAVFYRGEEVLGGGVIEN